MKFATLVIVVVSAATWVVSAPLAKEGNTAPASDVKTRTAEDLADIVIHEWYYNPDEPAPHAKAHSADEELTVDGVATRSGWIYKVHEIDRPNAESSVDGYATRSGWYYKAHPKERRSAEARDPTDDLTVDGVATRSGWIYKVHEIDRPHVESSVDGYATRSGWFYKAHPNARRSAEARDTTEEVTA